MIKILLTSAAFVLLSIFANPLFSQTFDIDTLVYNGSTSANLVIMADGYTVAEMSKFVTDAINFKTHFLDKAPYSYYKKYFNVFVIKTPSNESGVKHPHTATDCGKSTTVTNPDNYFGSTFDYGGIHRLVVPTKTSVISAVLANNFPNYNQIVILANSSEYGGSGGTYATATLNASSNEIAVHEVGHSFAKLADEYWAGAQYAAEKANMTQNKDPLTIKWKNWLTSGTGIGINQFVGQTWYKPTTGGVCDMEALNRPFCAVCSEAIIEKIHSLVKPIKRYAPISTTFSIVNPVYFSLYLIKPEPNTIKTKWILNGTVIGQNVDSLFISPSSLISGSNSLSVSVIDTISLTRSNSHLTSHLYVTNWTISNTTGINNISSKTYNIDLKLYPNPVSDVLNIAFKTEKTDYVTILIYSSQGVLIQKIVDLKMLYGENIFTLNVSKYTSGSYFVEFLTSNYVHTEKFIKK